MVVRGGEGAGKRKKKQRREAREGIRRINVNCFLRACIILPLLHPTKFSQGSSHWPQAKARPNIDAQNWDTVRCAPLVCGHG